MPGADQPVNPRRRKGSPKRSGDGNRVHDVAKGAKADEKEVSQPLTFLSRSRVEWSLGSPTIAMRPPYARTTARSGTVSTV